MIAKLPKIKPGYLWAIGTFLILLLVSLLIVLTPDPISAESCPNGSTHCPGDPSGDGQINCIDITQTELCILNPAKYPKENYPGWDANGDGEGPNSGDVLGVEYRTMEMWPHNHVRIHAPNEFPHCTNFDATVHVTYVEDFDSGIYDVIYNSSVLEVVSVTAGKINFVHIPVINYSFPNGPGMVRIQNDISGSSGVYGSGYFSTIIFHVIGSACDISELNFNESNCYLYDISAKKINATWQGDSVHVAPPPPTPSPTPTVSTTATASPTATISPTVSPTPTLPMCAHDDFNDNAINPSCWTTLPSGFGPTINETNQRLEMVFPANCTSEPVSGAFGEGYQSVCRLNGDFDMQIDYSLIDWPSENGVRIGFGVSEVPIELGVGCAPVERVSFGNNEHTGWPREVYLTEFSDGVKGVTATSDLSGKLRLVRAGTTLSGYYFSNGSWVLVHSGPVTAADVYIVIAAWSHNSIFADQGVKIAFDNFVVNQGDLSCEPMPTPTPTASEWAYNVSGMVTASGACGALSNYQMQLTLHYGNGTNSGGDIYLGGNCQTDFYDVRFTKADGVSLLDYWMEKVNAGVNATVWVEFDTISTSGTDFYIYYGNSSASSASNGSATFIIFDDLESGSVNTGIWDIKQSYGSVGIKTDKKYGNYSIGSNQSAGQGGGSGVYDQNHYFLKLADGSNVGYRVLMEARRWKTTSYWGHFCGFGFGGTHELWGTGDVLIGEYGTPGFPWDDTWYSYESRIERVNASAIAVVVLQEGVERYNDSSSVAQGSELKYGIQTRHNAAGDNTIYVRSDTVCVGKYCSPEPMFSWGPVPTPTPTASPTPTISPTCTGTCPTSTPTVSPTPTTCCLNISGGNYGEMSEPCRGISCYEYYPCGTWVNIEVLEYPWSGWEFDRWMGDVDTVDYIYSPWASVRMDGDYYIYATYKYVGCCTGTPTPSPSPSPTLSPTPTQTFEFE